jgi:uridine monophosphate synthetase
METFFSFLEKRVDDCSSLLCVGLDPHVDDLEQPTAASALDFCLRLVKATASYAAAFKPNAAFFEAFGPEGWAALKQVIDAIQEESNRLGSMIPVILDAKRGDIASTAAFYAKSAFENLGADAITLSPYLGKDSIEPFIGNPEKGVFLLCRTSNPGAADLQDLILDGGRYWVDRSPHSILQGPSPIPMYQYVASLARQWNIKGNIGLVVGATRIEALARVREIAPDLWFLIPGVGTQGGDLEAAMQAGLRKDGKGALINISRSISRSADPRKTAAELRDTMLGIRDSKIRARNNIPVPDSGIPNKELSVLADGLLDAGCIQFGEFTLKSGLISPIYIDLRRIISNPELLGQVGMAYLPLLKHLKFDRLAALPYAAIPIATSVSLQGNYPMIYPRKEVKAYGTMAEIEGEYHAGETMVVIDDLATTGGSKFEAIEKLTSAGLKVQDVVVLVDRQSGAKESLAEAGYNLHAVLTITQMLDYWETAGKVEPDQLAATRRFLNS